MRDIILDKIAEMRAGPDGWDRHAGMRWGKYYLDPNEGLRHFYSKKDKHNNGGQNAKILKDTTRQDFWALDDEILVDTFIKMIRIMSKQM
jgi:hypothetical protein